MLQISNKEISNEYGINKQTLTTYYKWYHINSFIILSKKDLTNEICEIEFILPTTAQHSIVAPPLPGRPFNWNCSNKTVYIN